MNRELYLEYASNAYTAARSVIRAVPADKLDYRPAPGMMSVAQLLHHIGTACGMAVQMVIQGDHKPMDPANPMHMPTLDELETCSSAEEALRMLDEDQALLKKTVMALSEEDFQTGMTQPPWMPVPSNKTVFCLDMVDHLTGHKMQLFQYLRILGEKVNTWTLYGIPG